MTLARDPVVRAVATTETPPSLEVQPCPVCDGRAAKPRFAIEGLPFHLLTCVECGLGSLHPRPDPQEIESFYPAEYYGTPAAKFTPVCEWIVRRAAAWTARSITRGLARGARVLDVGCGRGVLLEAVADRGFAVYGTELSREVASAVDPRAEVRIAARLADAQFADSSFDLVILSHVLEHLVDPLETLTEVRRILRPGGRLVVAVPNFSSLQARWAGEHWFHLDLPRHLFHYPAASLRKLLEKNGFKCRRMRHFSLQHDPFGWIQSALNRSRLLPRNAAYHQIHRGVRRPEMETGRLRDLALRLLVWGAAPFALAASVVAAMCRSGATVEVMATAE